MREQKLAAMSERPFTLPGCGPEEDLFSDFTMSPADMQFEVVDLPQDRWDIYLDMISSHSNMTSIPGRCLRLAILEKKSGKWCGFIRLGSPVINCKPRNQMLGQVFTQVQKYKMTTCLFETTSLYGSSKAVSQYDGMKPLIRFKGLTDSDFLPMLHGQTYTDLKNYVETIIGEPLAPEDASSRKLKISNHIISLTKVALKGTPEGAKFAQTIENAKNLNEQKRYFISDYGYKNMVDFVNGKTDKLLPGENYEKFHLNNIIEWWRKKAINRFETLKTENRIRTEQEVWTGDKVLDIIR